MSTFDPNTFIDQQVDQSSETKTTPVPEADYPAVVKQVKGNALPKGQAILEVHWLIDDEQMAKQLNRDELVVRQTIFLDIAENGALEFGTNKNVQLGKVREALGQNKPGQVWAPRMLEGRGPAMIKVTHRVDPNDPSIKYDGVSRVVSMKDYEKIATKEKATAKAKK
jgi:hypothetical protein